MIDFSAPGVYDRIVSIEMFEHMKNYQVTYSAKQIKNSIENLIKNFLFLSFSFVWYKRSLCDAAQNG